MATTTYTAPTAQQLEEARSLVFLVDTQKALENEFKVFGATLALEVDPRDGFGNQTRRIVVEDRTGAEVAPTYVHPNHGPQDTAYYVASSVRAARTRAAITEKA